MVSLAYSFLRRRCRPAQFSPHRCTGHRRQHTRLDHQKNPGRHGKLRRYHLRKHLRSHEHRLQPSAASRCPAHRLRGQTSKRPRKDNSSSILWGSLKPKDRTRNLRCRRNELPLQRNLRSRPHEQIRGNRPSALLVHENACK